MSADVSSPRFSFPPALDGRGALAMLAFLPDRRSGVAETSRLSALARFCAFLLGALLPGPAFFFSGFSGCGHSTSWVRSILDEGIHSKLVSICIRRARENASYHQDAY